jgi:hypothetical protein
MKRKIIALILGSVFVGGIEVLAKQGMATPIPFWLLLPGIAVGAIGPDSGFNPEGDIHPWGPISTAMVYAVNIGLYSLLAYIFLHLATRHRPASK